MIVSLEQQIRTDGRAAGMTSMISLIFVVHCCKQVLRVLAGVGLADVPFAGILTPDTRCVGLRQDKTSEALLSGGARGEKGGGGGWS